jgi:hypothetical protein
MSTKPAVEASKSKGKKEKKEEELRYVFMAVLRHGIVTKVHLGNYFARICSIDETVWSLG